MTGLTPAQQKVFSFVHDYAIRHGYSPSHEEVCRQFGYRSPNSVCKHLKQLVQLGYPQTPRNKKRALDLIAVHAGAVAVSFLGIVAAGTPIEAVGIPELIEVPENFLGHGNNFALRVRGDSMIEDGIRDGDILIITRQSHAENGQTVIALVRGEATVKKFYHRGNEIELRPANSRMEPLQERAEDVEIVGIVMGLLRNYRERKH